ncbi:MAG TPA: bifunctional tetrahydrofolate synthase/dihydrofolate synthase [Gammaproteobacteria bacterium]|jgi:dihydrofolate synthase/folylpolyglutamate synthase|nr:bifunctional tetrahydrofolate synthase/dihydrofolate synthase [Gammaproteobacteria bacterium]
MRFRTLPEWLAWQEQLHPDVIDLGLHRVRHVLAALKLDRPAYPILTVGGTNGKGSCVSFAEAMLMAAGRKTGAYVSPHLLRYNERVRVDGDDVTDEEFCESFARIDAVRGDLKVTYFEFGTLAAIDIFARRGVEAAVLEVGLGGRLDAVNALDPDAALVSSIGLDHQDWLGPDRESIGREKAGIFRAGKPAVCGDREPPASLRDYATTLHADLRLIGRDFEHHPAGEGWTWRGREGSYTGLPAPALPGHIQYDNAASVIAALQASERLRVPEVAIRRGLTEARIPARFQRVSGPVETVFDVSHNPDAARVLSENLLAAPAQGRSFAVVGMFKDKAAEEVARALAGRFQRWYLGGLEGPRGQSAAALAARVHAALPEAELGQFPSVPAAYAAAMGEARPGDRVVVFGSFQTVAAVLKEV